MISQFPTFGEQGGPSLVGNVSENTQGQGSVVLCIWKHRTVCFHSCPLTSSRGTTGSVQLGRGTAWSEPLWSQKFRLSWLRTFEGGQPEGEPVNWGGRSLSPETWDVSRRESGGSEVRRGVPKGHIIKGRKVHAFFLKSGTIVKLLSSFQVEWFDGL